MRKIWSILGNTQRLDGGAMFGSVPKAVWSKWFPADEKNRIQLACRALLVQEHDGRLLLFETGIGVFFSPKMRARFGVEGDEHRLLKSLQRIGFSSQDIDVVVLSHLHFDHAGGLLTPYSDNESLGLLFENAQYVVGRAAWERANRPHARDRASFIPELQPLLLESGRLEIVDGGYSETLGPEYPLHFSEGHTPGLMLTEIPSDDGPIIFCGDLIPGAPWVHLPITMGYDRYPEKLIDEKADLLANLVKRRGRLFFTHDARIAMGRVLVDSNSRYSVDETQEELMGIAV